MDNLNKEGRSSYEITYRKYRYLINHLSRYTPQKTIAVSIADLALRLHDEKQILITAQYHKLRAEVESLWYLIKEMRSVTLDLWDLGDGRHEDNPLPDVYAAALSMCMSGDWTCDRDRSLYRGQRNSQWQVVPTLYRNANAIEDYKKLLQMFANTLKSVYHNISDEQCVAAAQHFGAEAGTKTPLIDVTWDPFVALFFASNGAEANQLGVVDHLIIPEWKKLVASESDEPGGIKVIEVDEIQRIKKQRALFLATPDPKAYELYFPYRIWFRQQPDLVFEDEEYEQPISSRFLYPIEPDMQVVLDTFKKEQNNPVSITISTPQTNKIFDAAYLLNRAKKIMPFISLLSPYNVAVLKACAELYERGKEWSNNPVMFSLQRWEECVNLIDASNKQNERCKIDRALQFTLSRVPQTKRNEILVLATITLNNYLKNSDAGLIADRIKRLIKDTGSLSGTKGIFVDCDDIGAVTVIEQLKNYNNWVLMNFINVKDGDILALIGHVEQPALIIIAVATMPSPLRLLFKTINDRNQRVDYGNKALIIHPDTEFCLLTWGKDISNKTDVLNLIDYWG